MTIAVAWGGSFLVVGAGDATAVGACTANTASDYVGFAGYLTAPQNAQQTPEGASAYIATRLGSLCTTSANINDASQVYVGIDDQRPNSPAFAYTGYLHQRGLNCTMTYYEYSDIYNNHQIIANSGYCLTPNEVRAYRVTYYGAPGYNPPSTGRIHFDTSVVDVYISIDPWKEGWSFRPIYAGAVTFTPSNVPGSASNKNDIFGMGIQSVSDGMLRTVPCYLAQFSNPNARHYSAATSCDHTYVWTDPT